MEQPFSYVLLGDPIKYLMNNMKINIVQGDTIINFLDYFDITKQFTTYNCIENLLSVYATLQQIPIEDIALFNEAFGNMTASYVITNAGKVTMKKAVELGLLKEPLTTFELMDMTESNMSELDYNVISNHVVDKYIKDQHLAEEIKKEEQFEQVITIVLSEQNNQSYILLEDIVNMDKELDKVLLRDKRINLFVAIILNDLDKVEELLDNFMNYREAYILALKYNNQDIINTIKNYIINNHWYAKQLFNVNLSEARQDIYSHYKQL